MPRHRDPSDPTGTRRIARRYESALAGRFRRLRAAIRKAIVDDDVFGLLAPGSRSRLAVNDAVFVRDQFESPGRRAWAGFTRPETKQNEFLDWLRRQSDAGILQVTPGTPIAASAQTGWQNLYIDSAYRAGMRDAAGLVDGLPRSPAAIQASFLGPVHAERAGLIYARSLEELKGITTAMSDQIRPVLAQGLIDGRHPRVIARQINERVSKIGITRARVLARTETISAHAEASLTSFQAAGIAHVTNEAEFRTAGDDRVCPECETLEGATYPIEQARGVIPVHPNCRCRWLPVVPEGATAIADPDRRFLAPEQRDAAFRSPGGIFDPETVERENTRIAKHMATPGFVDEKNDKGLKFYVSNAGYGDLNARLREGQALTPTQKSAMASIAKNSVEIKEGTRLFRGTSLSDRAGPEDIARFRVKKGQVLDSAAPISLSSDGLVSADFSFATKTGYTQMFEIVTKKGARGVVTNAREGEFIMLPGQKIKIVNVQENVNILDKTVSQYITAEIG